MAKVFSITILVFTAILVNALISAQSTKTSTVSKFEDGYNVTTTTTETTNSDGSISRSVHTRRTKKTITENGLGTNGSGGESSSSSSTKTTRSSSSSSNGISENEGNGGKKSTKSITTTSSTTTGGKGKSGRSSSGSGGKSSSRSYKKTTRSSSSSSNGISENGGNGGKESIESIASTTNTITGVNGNTGISSSGSGGKSSSRSYKKTTRSSSSSSNGISENGGNGGKESIESIASTTNTITGVNGNTGINSSGSGGKSSSRSYKKTTRSSSSSRNGISENGGNSGKKSIESTASTTTTITGVNGNTGISSSGSGGKSSSSSYKKTSRSSSSSNSNRVGGLISSAEIRIMPTKLIQDKNEDSIISLTSETTSSSTGSDIDESLNIGRLISISKKGRAGRKSKWSRTSSDDSLNADISVGNSGRRKLRNYRQGTLISLGRIANLDLGIGANVDQSSLVKTTENRKVRRCGTKTPELVSTDASTVITNGEDIVTNDGLVQPSLITIGAHRILPFLGRYNRKRVANLDLGIGANVDQSSLVKTTENRIVRRCGTKTPELVSTDASTVITNSEDIVANDRFVQPSLITIGAHRILPFLGRHNRKHVANLDLGIAANVDKSSLIKTTENRIVRRCGTKTPELISTDAGTVITKDIVDSGGVVEVMDL